MQINGQYIHHRSTRSTDIKEATRKAEDFRAECVLYARGDVSMPRTLVDRIDPAKRFDRVVDDWLDELEKDAGKDARKLRNFRDKKQLCFAQNGGVSGAKKFQEPKKRTPSAPIPMEEVMGEMERSTKNVPEHVIECPQYVKFNDEYAVLLIRHHPNNAEKAIIKGAVWDEEILRLVAQRIDEYYGVDDAVQEFRHRFQSINRFRPSKYKSNIGGVTTATVPSDRFRDFT
jgi:hypothetical protein